MKFKRMAAAVIASAATIIPFSSESISVVVPSAVFAAEHGMGAALPDWIPSDYESALEFRNTYGATHIQDGLVCIVFKEQYEKGTGVDPKGLLRYEVQTTNDIMKELNHNLYSSKDSEYSYEVVVYYDPQDKGEFEVYLWDTWSGIALFPSDIAPFYTSPDYKFMIDDEKNITETDIFSWLPDSITEYNEYVSKNGKVSAKNEYVVFCLDSNAGTQYQWFEDLQEKHPNFNGLKTVECNTETDVPLDGGELKTIQVYQATKDGKSKIVWDYAPSYDYGEPEVEKTLIADCTVLDDATHVIINDAYIQDAEFVISQYSLYSGDLTVSSYEIYNKFSEPSSAVIESKKELSGFLSDYLNEKAINKFLSQYSDSFFENNVLLLNTYLDPYKGRIFKHGLNSVYYKDDKLTVDFTSVISANLMRTSYFDILQLSIPRKDYNGNYNVVWKCEEILDYDLKRISVIDEDTGENIAIARDNVFDMFGNSMKYLEGSNPYFWDTEFATNDWRELSLNEEFLPDGYVLSKDTPKEIRDYAYNSADIIFRVNKTKPIEVKYTIDKFSTITPNLFSETISETGFKNYEPAIATSKEELSEILSLYITEKYQKEYFSAYDEDFFNDNILLLYSFIDSTGGDKIIINDNNITADAITVYYSKPAEDFHVCNTDYFFILQAAIPKSAYNGQKTAWKCIGDTNGDGNFGIADLVTLQKWLLAGSETKLSDKKAADLCKDDVIDAFDLIAMRKMLIDVHNLNNTKKYAIEFQCLRNHKTFFGSSNPSPTMITNTDDLHSYLNSGYYGDALDKYDDNWFSNHKLMVISLGESSGSIRHEVTDLTSDYVTIKRIVPEIMTCDMAAWDILIELDKTATISDNFKVNLTELQIY